MITGLYLLWQIFINYNQNVYLNKFNWITLSIDIPKENEQTFLAAEQIFAQLHSIHEGHSFGEKTFIGKVVMWISLEIVSFGGQVKYLAYLPDKYRDLLEAAVYAQYPDAEIKPVEDYMRNVPQYNPDNSYYDVWGSEFTLVKEDAYPIRTYKYFEHQASQIIVDPLAGVLEALSGIKPYEMLGIQIMIRPVDDKWKDKARDLIKELKGERKESSKPSFLGEVVSGVLGGLTGIISSAAGVGEAEASPSVQEYEPPSKMMHLSPGEKDVITAIESNISKIGYETKIRAMYLAPKEKFRGEVKGVLIGAFKQFTDSTLNGIRPDTKKTWTGINPRYFPSLEKPFIDYFVKIRKKKIVRFYKHRKFSFGRKPFIFNIEELATIFHFPIINVKTPQLTKTEIKKSEAPLNLPTLK